jgi:hypothetical protein
MFYCFGWFSLLDLEMEQISKCFKGGRRFRKVKGNIKNIFLVVVLYWLG